MKIERIILTLLFLLPLPLPCGPAYSLNGYIETKAIYYPNKKDMFESRSRLLLEQKATLRDWLTIYLSGQIDGLLSNREEEENDILAKIDDAYIDFYFPKVEVKIGYSKVFWGKLDQLAPTDIVNPLDISRLFLEAERKEAKLPVPLFMVSPFFGEKSHLDLILVPLFQEGNFDQLNEKSSPFNVVQFSLPVDKNLPSKNLKNIEYGGRFSSTFREVDWSIYYFSGFQDFPSYRLDTGLHKINASFLRSDMFGYDFELVKGKWGIRGEGALLINVGFQKKNTVNYTKGKSFTCGLGIDRSFGDNYLNFGVLYRKIFVDDAIEEKKDEITLMANIERKFSYETKAIKLFLIYNTISSSVFLKGTFSINLLENLWADFSIGIFEGKAEDILSKFKDSDFFFINCKYNF